MRIAATTDRPDIGPDSPQAGEGRPAPKNARTEAKSTW
jgi:hypothetical protein